jgi:hypothetical protein
MANQGSKHAKEHRFYGSLLGALTGVALIGLAVHLGAANDFLASLWINGGDIWDYLRGFSIASSFIAGVWLIGRHISREGVAEHFYEQTPY